MPKITWTPDEMAIIHQAVADKLLPYQVEHLIPAHTREAIGSKMAIARGDNTVVDASRSQDDHNREQDQAFQLAMIAAIEAGLERAPRGVIKDDTPFLPTHFTREPIISGCGSSALQCAEQGTSGGRFINFKYA